MLQPFYTKIKGTGCTPTPLIVQIPRKLLLALLVSNCAGCLAGRLAGCLTLAAAAVSS